MAYTPTEWAAGDIITSTKLNKIENELVALDEALSDASAEIGQLEDFVAATFPQSTITDEAIATFTDGADGVPIKALTVDITPVQDLHGYDNPWPAGGSAQLLPPATSLDPVSTDGGNLVVTPYADGHYHIKKLVSSGNIYVDIPISFEATGSEYFTPLCATDSGSWVVNLRDENNTALCSSYAGNASKAISAGTATKLTIYITAGVSGEKDLYPMITSSALASGTNVSLFAPYENLCPISGWTGANIADTGKNLFDGSGLKSSTWNKYGVKNFLKPNTTYRFMVSGGTSYSYRLYMSDTVAALGNDVGLNANYQGNGQSQQFTTPADMSAYPFLRFGGNASGAGNDTAVKFQITLGGDEQPFSDYVGSVLPVTFPDAAGTVYGGSLKLNEDGSADLTVGNGYVDMGTLTWGHNGTSQASVYRFMAAISGKKPWNSTSEADNIICSNYKALSANQTYLRNDGISSETGANAKVSVFDKRYSTSTPEAFKTAMSGVQLVYELATPQTYHITDAGIVKTLLGLNNLWADTGDVDTLTYRVDPASYQSAQTAQIISALAAMLSYTETSYTATRAYNVNDFLSVNNKLYIVTADIAQGGTITPNTNVTETTVGAQLTTILNS